jgi:hypothetical protein
MSKAWTEQKLMRMSGFFAAAGHDLFYDKTILFYWWKKVHLQIMTGKRSEKTLSAPSLSGTVPAVLEYGILFGIGIIAIVLHARLRTPLNIPGHHGLEFMALLMAGRAASRIPWASSVSSLGIGLMLLFPVFGFKDPFMGIHYMLPGIFIDLTYPMIRRSKFQILLLVLFSGMAYTLIPLSRLVVHLATGYPYGAFIKHGFVLPFAGFFTFGLAGGFAGWGITTSVLKRLTGK